MTTTAHERRVTADTADHFVVRAIDLSDDGDIASAAAAARRAEHMGCDALWTSETGHDPFLPAVSAFGATERLHVATGVAVGFARSPMTMAQQAADLQDYSDGRFILGLGSQIRTHITKRYSMPWGKPIDQMTELIGAIRAIWDHWYDGEQLDFRGEYYQHTFNAEKFRFRPVCATRPPIHLAAVGPRMTSLAGEVADGFVGHTFVTEKFMREDTIPRLLAGKRAHSDDFDVIAYCNAVIDTDDRSLEEELANQRETIAMYGSTPAYRVVLDLHGLGDLHEELHRLSKLDRWSEMAALIDDDTLSLFVAWGEPAEVARTLFERNRGLATRLRVPATAEPVAAELATLLRTTDAD